MLLPGATDTIGLVTTLPGTYSNGASTNGPSMLDRRALDSQLNGALVVDSAGPTAPAADRVFVLSLWEVPVDTTGPKPSVGRTVLAINGKTWPHTERFAYAVGDTARWRWINPIIDSHPMHWHGFYVNVLSRGGEVADTIYKTVEQRTAVTELLSPSSTRAMQFTPTVPGHWLFRCPFTFDVSHFLSFDLAPDDVDAGGPQRGEPIAITVVNKLRQPTAVHWDGIELQDSYVYGVPLCCGRDGKLAPPIAPNDSSVAPCTSPRAGTFIYHLHNNEEH